MSSRSISRKTARVRSQRVNSPGSCNTIETRSACEGRPVFLRLRLWREEQVGSGQIVEGREDERTGLKLPRGLILGWKHKKTPSVPPAAETNGVLTCSTLVIAVAFVVAWVLRVQFCKEFFLVLHDLFLTSAAADENCGSIDIQLDRLAHESK